LNKAARRYAAIWAAGFGLMAAIAAAKPPDRLVVVVARPGDPRINQQHAALERAGDALRERDVVVQDITPETARRQRPELAVGPTTIFEVLLVGKDGGVKLRREQPVAASEIVALIDTMPMRRQEMRR
jgi:hypothetical protein